MRGLCAIGFGMYFVAAVGGEADGASRVREGARQLVGKISRRSHSFALWLSRRPLAERWLAATGPRPAHKPPVFESRSFRVVSASMPHIDRADGGHLSSREASGPS